MLKDCKDCNVELVNQHDGLGYEPRKHMGRGLCTRCYARHHRKGTLEEYPRLRRSRKNVPSKDQTSTSGMYHVSWTIQFTEEEAEGPIDAVAEAVNALRWDGGSIIDQSEYQVVCPDGSVVTVHLGLDGKDRPADALMIRVG